MELFRFLIFRVHLTVLYHGAPNVLLRPVGFGASHLRILSSRWLPFPQSCTAFHVFRPCLVTNPHVCPEDGSHPTASGMGTPQLCIAHSAQVLCLTVRAPSRRTV